mmetsp:Transcript_13086/g.22085  ORF Transcript_13086/g.22085 Transcript_13086/m.22085 type:complete len:80 (-) Transcript_13086:338-577(-)
MSKETHFTPDSKKLYYYVREPQHLSGNSEGFVDKIDVISELVDGEITIDGQIKCELNYGDKCSIDLRPEYSLKCIKFIV